MKNLILPFILLLTFIFSCRENDVDDGLQQKTASYDVYVAGKENNNACYWKNGNKVDLINGTGITAVKIMVENNDVYVFAIGNLAPFNYYIWKNNVKIDLSQQINNSNPSNYNASINHFLVNQGNIYVFGFVSSPVVQVPNGSNFYTKELCYWKNGVKTSLFTTTSNFDQPHVTTRNFTVHNGDVYIPVNKMPYKMIDAPVEVGYFKNNTYHTVASYSDQKNFRNIASGTGGVYLSMYDVTTNRTYYKNLATNIDTYTSQTVKVRFTVDGNAIYDFSNGQHFLKNDIASNFNYALGFNNILDLFALDNNVYQIRDKYTNDFKESSKVYINNTEIQHIDNINGTFNSIYVVEN
ncbi:hypothetical protein LPB90_04470 [Chryseobacterium sp. LC2016-29]|uniref:hypothetical protein n=1 Tax=Chryseobacterium sp. LC2016-29 TaxID=2897331 RepID=UPI001E296D2E|nr:hypothetical protein [Chryseobacterium sp. LC2016-29]MCD0477695.1 hypothetical protein [Chryseobacterium sp. LC2016-29]